jgi:hypothetical protein
MALMCPDARECRDDHSFNTREAEVVVADPFDVALEDSDLLVEVELTTNLIIAATASDGPLPADEIDRILGVVPDDGVA